MRRSILCAVLVSACVQAEGAVEEGGPAAPFPAEGPLIDDRRVVRAASPPPPISGGTLLLSGDTAIATDPDRDLVHIVSLDRRTERATVELAPGDEPGRAALDGDGLVYVVLRGAAALVAIDPMDGTIVRRVPTCANPRGVAFDPASDRVLVACAGGELVAHTRDGAASERVDIAPDLRDVFVAADGSILVSRFRDAGVLRLDEQLAIASRELSHSTDPSQRSTAWRTLATPDGGWLMIHQDTTTSPIDLETNGGKGSYGSGESGCEGPVASRLTMRAGDGTMHRSSRLPRAPLAVDVALSPAASQVAVAIAGRDYDEAPARVQGHSLAVVGFDALDPPEWGERCLPATTYDLSGQIVAVAFASEDTVVAQSREPATLFVITLCPHHALAEIPLSGESRRDTGHDLFHRDVGTGLACASCHPEGGDDGRVWRFDPDELERRTLSLRAGIAGTEPFHWSGDLPDFTALVEDTMQHRMGGLEQTPERVAALHDWVATIPPYHPERVDDEIVADGRELYVRLGCGRCHDDAALRAGAVATIDGEELQVPSLRGVALHPRYMHDGRSADLDEALDDMLRRTAPDAVLDQRERDAVIAYLESL